MVIAVDIGPISKNSESGHKVRGVGKYISLLSENLPKYDEKNSYIFFKDNNIPNSADLVHYPYFDPFYITMPLRKRKKTIVTVHDLIPLIHKNHFPVGVRGELKWLLNKILLKGVDGVIVDSDASGDDVKKIVGIERKKIHTVYLSCDLDYKPLNNSGKTNDIINKFNLPDKFLLYVGDVTWNKNLPMLIDAIEKTLIPIVMVGKALVDDEFDKKNIWNSDRNIVNLKTENNSLFKKLGFVSNEELNVIYNLAIALCMPSLDEGFGLPVLEAMNSGCPVITSKLGSLVEVGGDAVHYIDANDINSLVNAIRKISSDKNLRENLTKKGFVQARKFSLQKMVEDTVLIYQKYT